MKKQTKVKENKVSLLVHKYELFKMKPDESIQEMLDRFNDFLNGLNSLEKLYTNSEIVRKILKSFAKIMGFQGRYNFRSQGSKFFAFRRVN